MPTIRLQSSDSETFEVDVEIAKASMTIKTMLEGKSICSKGSYVCGLYDLTCGQSLISQETVH